MPNELYIYDNIGQGFLDTGVSAEEVRDRLAELDKSQRLLVRINSAGGDVFQAEAMATQIQGWPAGVDVQVDGLAASAASYLATFGETVTIAEGAMLMIHPPWAATSGNAEEFLRVAELLEKRGDVLAAAYARKSGKSVEDVAAAMSEETWFSSAEAVEYGLADQILDFEAAAYTIPKLYNYRNAPEPPAEPVATEPAVEPTPDLVPAKRQDLLDVARKRFYSGMNKTKITRV